MSEDDGKRMIDGCQTDRRGEKTKKVEYKQTKIRDKNNNKHYRDEQKIEKDFIQRERERERSRLGGNYLPPKTVVSE